MWYLKAQYPVNYGLHIWQLSLHFWLPKLLSPRCCNQMVSKTVTALIPAVATKYYLRLLVTAVFSSGANLHPPSPPSPSLFIFLGVCEHDKNV